MFFFSWRVVPPVLITLYLAVSLFGYQENSADSASILDNISSVVKTKEQAVLQGLLAALGQSASSLTASGKQKHLSYHQHPSYNNLASSNLLPSSSNQTPPSSNQAPPSSNQTPPSSNQTPPSSNQTPPPEVFKRPKLTWSAPITREDGSLLPIDDIDGYHVYYRLRHRQAFDVIKINGGNTTQFPLNSFAPGAYDFTISTLSSEGLESRKSVMVSVDLI